MSNTKLEASVVIPVVILIIAILIGIPFAVIWSINTLFGLAVGYEPANWLAAVLLMVTLRALTR